MEATGFADITDDSGEEDLAALSECILYIPWNVLPVTFVYFTHMRTFRAIRKAKETSGSIRNPETEAFLLLSDHLTSCES